MVEVTKLKSGGIYEDKESYSRLVMVDNWIFMANTAGRNLTTRYMSEDAVEQAAQVFRNARRCRALARPHPVSRRCAGSDGVCR